MIYFWKKFSKFSISKDTTIWNYFNWQFENIAIFSCTYDFKTQSTPHCPPQRVMKFLKILNVFVPKSSEASPKKAQKDPQRPPCARAVWIMEIWSVTQTNVCISSESGTPNKYQQSATELKERGTDEINSNQIHKTHFSSSRPIRPIATCRKNH